MAVFSKLKQFKDLRDQGKRLQDLVKDETAYAEAAFGKVRVIVDGTFKISGVEIDPEMLTPEKKEKVQEAIRDAHNDALKKIQRTVAAKMQQAGGFEMPSVK